MTSALRLAYQDEKRGSIITPKLREHYATHPAPYLAETQEELDFLARLVSVNAGTSVRDGAFHSSSLTGCLRAQIFAYLGVKPGRKMAMGLMNIFADGTWRHIRLQFTLWKAGILTDAEVQLLIPSWRFSGSMDGLITDTVVELKGTSQFSSIKKLGQALPEHKRQVHGYLWAGGYDNAIVFYEDKSHNDWIEYKITRDPLIINEIEDILTRLNDAVDNRQLPGVLNACKSKKAPFTTCPFAHVCFRADYDTAEAIGGLPAEQAVQIVRKAAAAEHRARVGRPTNSAGRTLRVRRRIDG